MLRLYFAQDNALNYVIIRDFDRDDNDAAIINWDLFVGSMTMVESADTWLERAAAEEALIC